MKPGRVAIDPAEAAFGALGDTTRRHIFENLKSGPKSVTAIASAFPVSRPAVSQHLKVLRSAGLVDDRPNGTQRIYFIDPNGLGVLRAWLDRFWDDALASFASEVDTKLSAEWNDAG